MIRNHSLSRIALTTMWFFFPFNIIAQKLPNVQSAALHAPGSIKIDGKLTEWNGQLQAHNNAVDIFYSVSNNENYLYFTIKATDPNVINRIINSGINITIQKTKNENNKVQVIYPVLERPAYFSLNRKTREAEDTTAKVLDSIMLHNNQLFIQNSKWIKVKGIPGLDTLISIYNEDDIKAAALFNNKKNFICELSIPLKYIKPVIGDDIKFSYHFLLKGQATTPMRVVDKAGDDAEKAALIENLNSRFNAFSDRLSAPTDFWGEYTLYK